MFDHMVKHLGTGGWAPLRAGEGPRTDDAGMRVAELGRGGSRRTRPTSAGSSRSGVWGAIEANAAPGSNAMTVSVGGCPD